MTDPLEKMSVEELKSILLLICPEGEFSKGDLTGQLILYTGLGADKDGNLQPIKL